jgi:hypothetical protein
MEAVSKSRESKAGDGRGAYCGGAAILAGDVNARLIYEKMSRPRELDFRIL